MALQAGRIRRSTVDDRGEMELRAESDGSGDTETVIIVKEVRKARQELN